MSRRMGKNLLKRVQKLEQNNKTERKHYSQVNTGTNIGTGATTPVEFNLGALIVSGANEGQRVGNSIKCIRLKLDYFFQTTAVSAINMVRMLVLRAKNSASSPTVDGVLFNSVIDPDVYHVLFDRMIPLVEGTSTEVMRVQKILKLNYKLDYSATTGDPENQDLIIYFASNVSANRPSLSGGFNLTYIDP